MVMQEQIFPDPHIRPAPGLARLERLLTDGSEPA